MKFVVLGKGKTGSLVAEIATQRGHSVEALTEVENANGAALTEEKLRGVDSVIDFTTPAAVLENISACVRSGGNMVVGTTGWYAELDYVRALVEERKTGFVFGSNFSPGVNVFFDIAKAAAQAGRFGYTLKLVERHHVHKKDQPSGTAVTLQNVVRESGGGEPEITSVREGETIGTHVLLLDSENDTMMLVHDAKNRRGFADGAVRAAEWIAGKRGFYDFRQIFEELQ